MKHSYKQNLGLAAPRYALKTRAGGLAIALAFGPGLAAGEDFTYSGNGPADPHWQDLGGLFPSSIAPNPITSLDGNNVTIDYTLGTNPNFVFGAYSADASPVSGNTVLMRNGAVVSNVYGGHSSSGNATGNSVTISSGTVGGNIYGGITSGTGNAENNVANVTGATVSGNIYAGRADGTGNANNNTATMTDGTLGGFLVGGRTVSGSADSNSATATNTTVQAGVWAGYSAGGGNATNNTATMVNSTTNGGFSYGGVADTGSADGNTFTMTGSTANGWVIGGQGNGGHAFDNTVNISDSSVVTGDVIGGAGVPGDAINNSATISGSSVGGNVYGGLAGAAGSATNNSVTISGTSVSFNVIGGSSSTGSATNNSVTISGGSVGGNVFGGIVGSTGSAINNTVTISGNPTLNGTLIGGGGGGGGDHLTGNTLNVQSSGMSALGVANFQNYNFTLPANIAAGQTMLTVTNPASIAGSTVGITGVENLSSLQLGEQIILISSTTGAAATSSTTTSSGGVNYTYALGGGSALAAFFGGIQTAGDYSLPAGAYTVAAGTLANQGISLDVGGVLSATGPVSFTSNASNSAALRAGTLVAPALTLAGANTSATIGTLDMSANNTALALDGVSAANVNVGNLTFANGHALDVTSTNGGSMTAAGNLSVSGTGNSYNSPIAYNAAGKSLSFNLPSSIAAGQTMLTTSTAADITGSTVGITGVENLSSLKLGEQITLISNTTGAAANNSATASFGAVNYTYALGGGTALTAFLGGIQTAGDYSLPAGAYSAAAGTLANQGISLDVGGVLSATGPVSFTSNASNSAALRAGTLVAPALTLTGANTSATIGTLDMSANNTALALDGVSAANVNVGNLTFANGHALDVTSTNGGSMTAAGNLSVSGTGNSYNSPIAYNAAGKSLSFYLPSDIAAGQTMLTTSTAADITGSTVGITGVENLSSLQLGEQIILISSTTGAAATSSTTTSSGGVNYTYALGGGSALAAFFGGIQTAGDYSLPAGAYSAAAGTLANQGISLDVGGVLSATGPVSFTSNASNGAALRAGTLVAPALTLTGANTSATIGTLDMSANSTALALDGVSAANVNVGNLTFANGHALDVTSTNGGSMTAAGNLSVSGTGNSYNSPIAYNAAGKSLSFDLPSSIAAGQTMLTTSTAADITGSTVGITGVENLSSLQLGEQIILISSTTGAAATSSTTTSSGGVNYTYALGGGSALAAFFGGIQTAGDYSLPAGAYSAAAGTLANQGISLDVGGVLSATGPVSFTSNANSATLRAGTLVAPSLTLAGANTSATIGTLDMSANNTALALDGVSAANVNVGNLTFANAHALDVTSTNGGSMTAAGNLSVSGTGNSYNSPIAYNAAGKSLSFYLPSDIAAGQTMLTMTTPGATTDISNSSVGVGINNPATLKAGDEVVLLDASTGGLTATGINSQALALPGMSEIYSFDITATPTQLLATMAGITLNPQTKALSEGKLAGLAFTNQGADLIVDLGMSSALRATSAAGQQGAVAFAAIQSGSSEYDTGSHIDVDGPSLITGVAWRNALNSGSVLGGFFFEAGRGNYDSHNSFNNAATVHGDGDTSYTGGGLLGRYDLPSGVYVEGSVRAGEVETDFSSADLHNGAGVNADYDSSSSYYGGHAGLGYVYNLNETSNLDFTTRYIGTHQSDDSETVAGERVSFDSATSQRWRNGARFNYAQNKDVSWYAGAYYDYEFSGEQGATVQGHQIDEPELTGGTGVGELGVTMMPVKGSNFHLDLGLQGYTGVRQGVAGSVQLKWDL